MPKDLSRTVIAGLVLIGLGLLAILLGYNGAAKFNCVDCQLPFIISGGILGLSLIILGTGLIVFEALRRGRAHIEQKLDAVIEALHGYVPNGSAPSTAPASDARTNARPAKLNGMVVVGRASFHRPDCRLVEGKEDLDYAPLADAEARGLQPCRVCEPARETAGKKR